MRRKRVHNNNIRAQTVLLAKNLHNLLFFKNLSTKRIFRHVPDYQNRSFRIFNIIRQMMQNPAMLAHPGAEIIMHGPR